MIRALLPLALLSGCFAGAQLGGSGPVGSSNGSSGPDIALGFGGEHRGERVRAGGGLHLGGHFSDNNGFIPFGAMGWVDVGLTEPNERGGRLLATGQLAVGFARGYPNTDSSPSPDGGYAQMFLGLGFGATRSNEPRKLEADHVALGLLLTRFSPEDGDGYWLLGGALSFSFGLNTSKISAAFSESD